MALRKFAPTTKPVPKPREPEATLDAFGTYKRQIRQLAMERGVDFPALLDEFWGRASARWYMGAELEEAERLAWDDLRGRQ